MSYPVISQKAQQACSIVAKKHSDKPQFIMVLIAVVGMIVQLVELYLACKKDPPKIQEAMAEPSPFEEIVLRRAIMKNLLLNNIPMTLVDDYHDAFKEVMQKTTVDETSKMCEEVKTTKSGVSLDSIVAAL